MRFDRVRELIVKDLSELRANRQAMGSLVVFPAIFVLSAIVQIQAAISSAAPGSAGLRDSILASTGLATSLLMIIAPFISVVTGSTGIVLEKTNHSLEPLLADPITDSELLWGKALAPLIPGLLVGYAAYAIVFAAGDALAWGILGGSLYPSLLTLYQMLILMTLLGLIATFCTVIISSRATDVRGAQQISMAVVLPIVLAAVVGVAVAGSNVELLAAVTLAFALITYLLVRTAIQRFHRESILVAWK